MPVFKPEESRPARALAYAPNLRGDDSKPHRYRHMLRGSVEGVIGGSFNNGSGRASVDEDEKAADDVSFGDAMLGYTHSLTLIQN